MVYYSQEANITLDALYDLLIDILLEMEETNDKETNDEHSLPKMQ
jgi:hypothetical protein